MLDNLLVRIFWKNQPFGPTDDFIPNIRIHNLEPSTRGLRLVGPQLPVAQLDEAGAPGRGVVVTLGAEENVDAVEGGAVGFVFALD